MAIKEGNKKGYEGAMRDLVKFLEGTGKGSEGDYRPRRECERGGWQLRKVIRRDMKGL